MKRFMVHQRVVLSTSVVVDAESDEKARELADAALRVLSGVKGLQVAITDVEVTDSFETLLK